MSSRRKRGRWRQQENFAAIVINQMLNYMVELRLKIKQKKYLGIALYARAIPIYADNVLINTTLDMFYLLKKLFVIYKMRNSYLVTVKSRHENGF